MPGTITFRPVEANLTHDTDWLGKMDPYCIFTVGAQKARSQVCRHGGKRPHWEDAVTLQTDGYPAICRVEVMDKDKLRPDDSIAATEIDLNEIQNFGRVSRWYPVYHRRKLAGEILIEAAYQPAIEVVQQPVITQPIIPTTVIPTEKVIVEEKVITSAPIITNTTTYTEFNQGLPLNTGLGLGQQQFIGGSYEIPTTTLGTQGLPLGGQTFGQTLETSTYINQSTFGQGLPLGGIGLAGSQLPLTQNLGGLRDPGLAGTTQGYYNAGSPAYTGNNLSGNSALIGTGPALLGTNYGLSGDSGLLVSKTSALGPGGGIPHGYPTLRGATNAGYSIRPGYTLGATESNPTTQANLDTNGGGFFNKPGRERRAEPYALSNPGTYGIPHGQTIDTAGHLRPEVPLNRQAPVGQINLPGYTGYVDNYNKDLNPLAQRAIAGLQSRSKLNEVEPELQPGFQSGYQPGLQSGFQSGLPSTYQSGLQPGFQSGLLPQSGVLPGMNTAGYKPGTVASNVQPTLGTGLQPNLGANLLQPNLTQSGVFQPTLGQGSLPGSRNNIF